MQGKRAALALSIGLALLLPHFPAHPQVTVAGFTSGSFRVTETGGASYTIPVRVPPGIAGMEPKLAIAVNGQGGNGLLGLGGGLQGLSVIHRCSKTIVQDGFTSGINYDSHDRYCLDGQRLVAITGSYGANGTEYRTERESFTKVVSYGTAGTGPAWFKVWTKSGQVMEYGNSTDSLIEAQGKSSARAWALNKVSDTVGSYFTVTYSEDNANGDYYPTRIDYTGNAAGSVTPFASVRFTYATRSDIKPAYVGGSVIKTMNRLTNVKTYVGETVVTDYRLAYDYSPNSGPSRPISITECSGDGTECLSPTSFTWQNPSGGAVSQTTWSVSGAYLTGDVNGDGFADMVLQSGTGVSIQYSTGGGFGGAVSVGAVDESCSGGGGDLPPVCVADAIAVGDFDGNGRADIVSSRGKLWLSTSGGFSQTNWPLGGSLTLFAGDLNGDGLADVVYQSGTSVYVAYSAGAGFQSAVLVGTTGQSCAPLPEGAEVCTPHAITVGDFDGNGRADIATSAGTVWLSITGGFSQVNWGTLGPVLLTGDVNGDGLSDVILGGTQVYVRMSNGNGFDASSYVGEAGQDCGGEPQVCVTRSIAVGDFDGNARADVVSSASAVWLFNSPAPDRLSAITASLGGLISVTHKPLTDGSVYSKDSDASWPVRDLRTQGPLYVVSAASGSDGIGGTRTTNYFYRGAKAHMKGGGFLGFRQLEATDAPTGLVSVSTFRQGYPYHGLPLQSQRKQSSGTLIAQATTTWTDTGLTPAVGSGGNYHKTEATQNVEESYELNGSLVTSVTTTTTYDAYGNADVITVGTGDGYQKVTDNDYTNDTTNWFLGRLTGSSVASTKPGQTLTRASAFQYDAVTGLLTKEVIEPANSNLCLVTIYSHDAFGNKVSATTRNCNGSTGEAAAPTGDAVFAQRASSTSFAAATANPVPGQFPTSSTNALNHTELKEFDPKFGVVTKLTGPNALVTQWAYDKFGRKTSESRADGTTSTWAYSSCGICPANARYLVTASSTGRPTTVSYFDTLNRAIRTEAQGFDGTWVRTDTEYDALGRTRRVSRPYFATGTPKWSCLGYDLLNRVTSESRPTSTNDNASCDSADATTTSYNGLVTTVTNPLNQTETRTKNSQGQLVSVTRQ
jgi:YD repeat-containing protein